MSVQNAIAPFLIESSRLETLRPPRVASDFGGENSSYLLLENPPPDLKDIQQQHEVRKSLWGMHETGKGGKGGAEERRGEEKALAGPACLAKTTNPPPASPH